MTCVLQKPAKPGKCPERRVQTHPPWLIRGHPGEAADWAIGHRTLCQFVVKRLASSLALSDSNEDNAGIWEKLLHSFFFNLFNICWLEHPHLHFAKHQWQKWRRHSSCWVVKFTGQSTLTGKDFIQMESQEGEAKTFQSEGTGVTMWGKISDA